MEDSVQEARPSKSEVREHRKWTVMVYMVADKDTDLDAVAVHDLREMERGANDHAHVVVQVKRAWPVHPQRYLIRDGRSIHWGDDADAVSMADASTLQRFVGEVLERYESDHYCLVLWGHAYGLGFGRDHNEPLTLPMIREALDAFCRQRGNEKLELLGANACAMAYAEAAYELHDSAVFMVASQLAVPYAGWPYETILRGITPGMTPEDLGRLVAETYVDFYDSLSSGGRASMTLLKLEPASHLGVAVAKLARALTEAMTPNGRFSSDRQAMLRDVFMAAAAGDVRPLLDLEDLCRDLEDHSRDRKGVEFKGVETAAAAVRKKLEKVVLFPKLQTQHGHDPSLDDLHGLGIYAPFVTDDVDLERLQLGDEQGRDAYKKLSIFQAVGEQATKQDASSDVVNGAAWPELVYERLRREIDADLFESLSGIDATYREDRRNAIQIALAIDASFNKFDRAAGEARKATVEPMKQAGSTAAGAQAKGASKSQRFDRRWLKLLRLQTSSQPPQQAQLPRVPNGNPSPAVMPTGAERSRPQGSRDVRPGRASHAPELLSSLVPKFQSLEHALGEVERAVLRGLTHEKLGLGPVAGAGLGEPPKTAELGPEPPKPATLGPEPPKPATLGDGVPGPVSARPLLGGDLRFDLAIARVAALFGEVGGALAALEQATTSVEMNIVPLFEAAWSFDGVAAETAKDLERVFSILQEASSSARRTVRRVLLHPVYGLGPGTTIGRSERQALARAGGLDRLSLRLM